MARSSIRPAAGGSRHWAEAEGPPPNVCLLSNGRYSVMLTQAGAGYSTCEGLDVTRWHEDATSDGWGQFFYSATSMAAARGRPVCSRSLETPTTTKRSRLGSGRFPATRWGYRNALRDRGRSRRGCQGSPDHVDQSRRLASHARRDQLR